MGVGVGVGLGVGVGVAVTQRQSFAVTQEGLRHTLGGSTCASVQDAPEHDGRGG